MEYTHYHINAKWIHDTFPEGGIRPRICPSKACIQPRRKEVWIASQIAGDNLLDGNIVPILVVVSIEFTVTKTLGHDTLWWWNKSKFASRSHYLPCWTSPQYLTRVLVGPASCSSKTTMMKRFGSNWGFRWAILRRSLSPCPKSGDESHRIPRTNAPFQRWMGWIGPCRMEVGHL